MKKSNWRFIRCIWHDKVDLIMWLVIIGIFIYHIFWKVDVSKFLFMMIFYVYYFMYRKFTFWQDRRKMYQELKNRNADVDFILNSKDW